MQKPNNYDNVSAYGEYKPLSPGGHILTIMRVEEKKNRSGGDMLVIQFDTAKDDSQPGYFTQQWKSDTRPEKRWGGVSYQNVLDYEGNTNRGFKTFTTSVEVSNPGFSIKWGDSFCECLKGRRVGAIFRREEYMGNDGRPHWSTKLLSFRSVKTIQDGVDVPEDKPLSDGYEPPAAAYGAPYAQPTPYSQIQNAFQELSDDDPLLPF